MPVRRAPSWRGIAVAYGLIATVLAALYAAAHPEVLLGVLMGLVAVGVASRYRRRLGGSVSDRSGVDTFVEADSPRIGESTAAGRTSGLPSWSGSD